MSFLRCYSRTERPAVSVFDEVKAFALDQGKLSMISRLGKRGAIAMQVADLTSKLDDKMKNILASILSCWFALMELYLFLLAGGVRYLRKTRFGRSKKGSSSVENYCGRATSLSRWRKGNYSSDCYNALPHSPISQFRIIRQGDVKLEGEWKPSKSGSKFEYCKAQIGGSIVTVLRSRTSNETALVRTKSAGPSTNELVDHPSIHNRPWQVYMCFSTSTVLMLLQAPKHRTSGRMVQCPVFGSSASRSKRR